MTCLSENIFVFGSNLAGRHGKGSAREALLYHGAIRGRGVGRMGSSYAIPTKGRMMEVLPLPIISGHVERFLAYATENSHLRFDVVAIGCGNAGYTPEEIAPLFSSASSNVSLPDEFEILVCRI